VGDALPCRIAALRRRILIHRPACRERSAVVSSDWLLAQGTRGRIRMTPPPLQQDSSPDTDYLILCARVTSPCSSSRLEQRRAFAAIYTFINCRAAIREAVAMQLDLLRPQRAALSARRLAAPDSCLARPARSARSSPSGIGGLPSSSPQHGGLVRSAAGGSVRPASS
jgi:hypothetical protein